MAMKITLHSDGRDPMKGEVADDNWVRGSIEAAWSYVNYTGSGSVTVSSEEEGKIATVSLEIHDGS